MMMLPQQMQQMQMMQMQMQQMQPMAMKRPMGGMQEQGFKKMRPDGTMESGDDKVCSGEVRFDSPTAAQQAVQLTGSQVGSSTIAVELDPRSKDGTKVIVQGVPASMTWAMLKDLFVNCGNVVYANVKRPGSGTPCAGSVRFETPEMAEQALLLSGSLLQGQPIELKRHAGSKDGTKLQVFNLPSDIQWQELKDWFAAAGVTAIFADIGSAAGGSAIAEVRYENPEHAKVAMKELNGSMLAGGQIFIQADQRSQDGSKLFVTGVPPGIEWQELKDHFSQLGPVAFAQVTNPNKGKGKGGKGFDQMGGGGGMMNPFQAMMSMMGPMMGKGGGGGGWGGPMMKGGAKGCGKAQFATTGFGEVRFENPIHAMMAVQQLNGSALNGAQIMVTFDPMSADGSKLHVSNIAVGTSWHALKDHFAQVGQVAFAGVK